MTEIALMKARANLTGLSRELQKNPKAVVRITHRGKSAMTLMSSELYETLVETLEAVSDQATLDACERAFGTSNRAESTRWTRSRPDLG